MLKENIREAFRSLASSPLKAIITGAIIAIGMIALVGVLTAIDGIQASVTQNLSELGSNSFEIVNRVRGRRGRSSGPAFPSITYRQAQAFRKQFNENTQATVSLSARISSSLQLSGGDQKTDPNITLMGIDSRYLPLKGINLAGGRNFTAQEVQRGAYVIVLGHEVANRLFTYINPVGQWVKARGRRYLVVGITDAAGSAFGGQGADRTTFIPLENARQLAQQELTFGITAAVKDPKEMDDAIEAATVLMRKVRQDRLSAVSSFNVVRSESLYKALNDITNSLRIGGLAIGFVTLMGAAIALINIMLVTVTERTQEIGVRKALGARPSAIRQQFLVEAITICVLGGLAGIVLGIAGGNAVVSLIGANAFVVPWLWIALGLTACLVLGITAGYLPARKASRIDPIISLRYE